MPVSFSFLPSLEEIGQYYESHVPRFFLVILVLVILLISYFILTYIIRRRLNRLAKTERQIANVRVFLRLWKYFFFFIFILVIIFTYTQSLTALGLSAGFLGAALGWALQTPITGVAAWLMIIIKKPFMAGDRVIIDGIQGDVYDITLSHVYLEEFGGTTSEDERSGRFIMIPTSTLWTAKVVNFTLNDDYVLKEVPVAVTYGSNLDKAIKIAHEAALAHSRQGIKAKGVPPVERIDFLDSAVEIRVKYFVDVRHLAEVATAIRKQIFDKYRKSKDIEIAYPHMQLVMADKTAPMPRWARR